MHCSQGAGDAFVGAFAYFMTRPWALGVGEAMRRACVVAGVSVQHPGTQASYPSRSSLPQALFQ